MAAVISNLTLARRHVRDGISLNVFIAPCRGGRPEQQIVFVPGWGSTPSTWRYFLPKLCELGTVHYFETREKPRTFGYDGPAVSLRAYCDDLRSYITSLPDGPTSVVGSSLGATVILETLAASRACVNRAVAITPNVKMPFPRLAWPLTYVPDAAANLFRPLILSYAHVTSWSRDSSQLAGMLTAIKRGDMSRLLRSFRGLRSYEMNLESMSRVGSEILLISASRDQFHDHSGVQEIAERLPNCSTHDMITFTNTHSSACAEAVVKWHVEHGWIP